MNHQRWDPLPLQVTACEYWRRAGIPRVTLAAAVIVHGAVPTTCYGGEDPRPRVLNTRKPCVGSAQNVITTPTADQQVAGGALTIEGAKPLGPASSMTAQVVVHGKVVQLAADGSFSRPVSNLKPGPLTIEVTAVDVAGNEATAAGRCL